ncbi:riboflavin transporter 2-like [Argopecten irradians]|uniref:riboflavin transporter 2-like n=1 Tax=Argopecten irradians TaxID=31199 RepID=UPI00371BB531
MNSAGVYILVVLFGTGSWLTLNGIWVELPLMVPSLPEGWALPSYLNVIIQVANIGPIGLAILFHFAKDKISDKFIIYALVTVGCASVLCLLFFWDTTSFIAGQCHSTGLLTLVFVLATVCCSTSVVFLPFMTMFKKHYITAFFIGQGLSGLLPSVAAIAQGVGSMTCENVTSFVDNITNYALMPVYQKPIFSVEHFMLFLFLVMLLCLISFVLLNTLPCCKQEYSPISTDPHDNDNTIDNENQVGLHVKDMYKPEEEVKEMTHISLAGFLILNLLINTVTNGCLPPVQTYSCLPYGNDVYHWSVTLSNIANPIACFLAFLFPVVPQRIICCVAAGGFATTAFIMYTASASPDAILLDSGAGPILVVLAWIITMALLTFAKVTIATLFRSEGKESLRVYGIGSQAGSTLGAIIMYILINVSGKFENAATCPS